MRETESPTPLDLELEGLPPAIAAEFRRAMPLVPTSLHARLLALASEVLRVSSTAASEFLRSCPFVTGRAGHTGLEAWCREGVEILRRSEQSGIAYFRLATGKSALLVQELSSGVELPGVRNLLEMYCLALTGEKAPVLSARPAGNQWSGQSAARESLPDGRPVFLPEFVNRYPSKPENFAWYKVMATHQVGHVEFGTYDFCLDGTGRLFEDLGLKPGRPDASAHAATDLERFVGLFDDTRLARDILTTVEDGRIDSLVKHSYRGIAGAYARIQSEALSTRPALTPNRLREAFLEVLVQMSLGRFGYWQVPAVLRTPLYLAGVVMKRVLLPDASVEDSAGATIRLYRITSCLADRPAPDDGWDTVDLRSALQGLPVPSLGDVDDMLRELPLEEASPFPYASPAGVEFRGVHRLDSREGVSETAPVKQDETERGSSYSAWQASDGVDETDDLDDIGALAVDKDALEEESSVFGANTANKESAEVLVHPEQRSDRDDEDGALEVDGPFSFLYDEWDFRAGDYRLRWCRVRQRPLQEGTPDFFDATLNEYSDLATVLRRQFELLNPRFSRKVKRLQDGEDFDLDAVVDFVITRKAGQTPDGKVYWRRNKTERDVSVVFLLDMSSSTIEYINRSQRGPLGQPVFRDYRDYFEWLQFSEKHLIRPRDFKRIIDLEKESIVLLINALETVGDTYAIYGFSGYGRENVEFYVIKDLEEEFSERVKTRIDSITPQHGTRMGPAIRHATWKLEQLESRSRFLFLISDGRPEDHGYGRDGLERDYAINDTKMALVEARYKGITPFCLTVDRAGHDYLRTICGDMGYEVVADIESLPRCLPTLYGRFTA